MTKTALKQPKNKMVPVTLDPLLQLKGVGSSVSEKLNRLNIHSISDLFFHLPLRYQDRTRVVAIGSLRAGMEITVRGEIQLTEVKYGRRRMLLSRIADGTGFLTLRFFHFNATQQAGLARGNMMQFFGEVRRGTNGLEMIHPEYRKIEADSDLPAEEYLTPIYPSTEGLGQNKLRSIIDSVVRNNDLIDEYLVDWLPDACVENEKFPGLRDAIKFVHYPPPGAATELLQQGLHASQQRLAFEELLAHHLSLRMIRLRHENYSAPSLKISQKLKNNLLRSLPFTLTAAQARVAKEIENDLTRATPMQRLIQGDVGCGKTIVAALAALQAVEAGFQVVILAPTELLAEQHRVNFMQWFEPLGLSVLWLSGKIKGKARKEVLAAIKSGAGDVVVGTQALYQEGVEFSSLGLVIIDEQHRFGVHQRMAMRDKGKKKDTAQTNQSYFPHQLVMTATPIPRTLAQTAYADLDLSMIDELPPGRTPVDTVVISEQRRNQVVERVYLACREGRQAYWVCTLVEESEHLQCQAAEVMAEELHQALPDVRVGLVHGRLKSEEKNQVMASFKKGELDLLVATTVIEVGVDVPNASLMIIDNAERLGLSQLHQLRGRVGRGAEKSSCVLLYGSSISKTGKERLAIMRETNDGFLIAQKDLELRGPGELLGTRQTGLANLRIADFQRDQKLIPQVMLCANKMIEGYPQHIPKLIHRWLGEGLRYSKV